MFFHETDLPVSILTAGRNAVTKANFPFFQNIRYHKRHKMVLTIRENAAVMTVDDLPESEAFFPFQNPPKGCVSLATCSTAAHPGGITDLRITEEGRTVLELDFSAITGIEDLNQWFDCYYFKELKSSHPGVRRDIPMLWDISSTGTLRCIQPPRTVKPDLNNFCLLTLRDRTFQSCTIELGFEQCWVCYGIVFGCPAGHFPYYYHSVTHTVHSPGGGYAYVEAEGYRTIKGDISPNAGTNFSPQLQQLRVERPLSTFSSGACSRIRTGSTHSLIFHTNANARYTFGDNPVKIRSGSITYLPPDTSYELEVVRDTQLSVDFICYRDISWGPAHLELDDPKEIEHLFHKLVNICSSDRAGNNYECLSLFYRILSTVQKGLSQPAESISPDLPPLLQKALEYITENFKRSDLSIPEIAAYCGVSDTYFRRIFQKYMHTSPKKYILVQQIDYAKFLLDSHFYRIYEVGEKCGFDNSKYFISAFRRLTGMSPKAYADQLLSPSEAALPANLQSAKAQSAPDEQIS